MTLEHQTTVKNWFLRGKAPTQSQFASFIESSMPEWQINLEEHAQGGTFGIPEILSSVSATVISGGAVGNQVFRTTTTAALNSLIDVSAGTVFQLGIGGSTSRTQTGKSSDIYSARDFGAVGDGSTDDTAAFRAFFAAATAASRYIPAGTYRLEGPVTASSRGYQVYGAGPASTILRWSSSAAGLHGLWLKASNNSRDYMHVKDLTFFTAKSSAASVGLKLDYNAQVFVSGSTAGQERTTLDRTTSRFMVDNCQFIGVSGNLSGWNTAIDNFCGLNGTIRSCRFVGWIQGNVAGFGALYPAGTAIRCHGRGSSYQNGHPVSFDISGNIIYFYETGAAFEQCEGAYVHDNVIVACGIPVYFIGPAAAPFAANPYLTVSDNDMSFFTIGVQAEDASDVRITNNEIIARIESSAAELFGVMLRSTNAVTQDASIYHNSFVNSLRNYTGVRTEGARRVTIGGNSFRNTTTGLQIAANAGAVASQECVVDMQNTFTGVTTKYAVTSAVSNFIGCEVSSAAPGPGHMDLPNGLQIRFGTVLAGTSAANSSANWSRPFNSAALSAVISNGDSAATEKTFNLASINVNGFTFSVSGTSAATVRVNYIAIGS